MRFAHVLAGNLLVPLLACGPSAMRSGEPSPNSPLAELEAHVGYPPASYRFALSRINHVHLLVAHILITHQETAPKEDGPMFVERSSRSRETALRLATKLSQQLVSHPDAFAELARRYSEDRRSAAHGGVLGVVEAPALPMTVLDALAAITTGQISHVVESEHGFHIVQRLAVPPPQRVAAHHILIRYAGAEVTSTDTPSHSTRTREAARLLAEAVAAKARARPEAFPELVHAYSEDVDSEDPTDDGDIGVWSINEGASTALATYLLSQLPVGGISAVLETRAGFEVLQRSAVTERQQLAARYISVEAQRTSAGGPNESPQSARALAQELAGELSRSPERFDAVSRERCAPGICAVEQVAWEEGRAPHRVDRLVSSLSIGSVSAEPLGVGSEFRIYQRVTAPPPTPEPVFETELPNVEAPPVDSVIARFDGRSLAAGTRGLLAQSQPALDLDPEQQLRFRQVLEELALSFEREDDGERPRLLQRSRAQLLALLGPVKFEKFQRIRDERLRRYLLQ